MTSDLQRKRKLVECYIGLVRALNTVSIAMIWVACALFVCLKLTGTLAWSWWWLLAPASIYVILIILIIVATGILEATLN
jgi:hypothetical protein